MQKIKQTLCGLSLCIISLSACKDKNEPQPTTQPAANFSHERKLVEPGDTIYFTNTSENASNLEWDFGNGSTSNEQNPYVVYSETGTYTIKLTATNQEGITSEKTGTVKVGERYLTRINATNVPLTKSNGDAWDDDGSAPDIQAQMWAERDTISFRSSIHNNFTNATPLSISFQEDIKFTNVNWRLMFFDRDSDTRWEPMASVSFNPISGAEKSYTNGKGIIKTNHPFGIEIEFEVR